MKEIPKYIHTHTHTITHIILYTRTRIHTHALTLTRTHTHTQIETVDKYQGSQNDYIILSLVRTKHVGHVRDVRRLVVAMSRARLGLYVLCRYVCMRGGEVVRLSVYTRGAVAVTLWLWVRVVVRHT